MDSEKIRQLREQIEQEKNKMSKCSHAFSKAFYNPEKEMVPYGIHYEGKGSDPYPVADGYNEVDKPRWTRVCVICGGEQHTSKTKSTGSEPDFN